ncbi:MAG: acyl-CoA dehydratase activase [Elusimicrobiota bacterium]|jgi:predicted CoA-substrate-specific enzyme activase|nr:acyl-CoA dehydratase activase [Elusimicrobiota bacterium]
MQYYVGVDLGSTAIKVVFVKDGALAWHKAVPTAPGQEALARKVIAEGLRELNIGSEDISGVAATGYGKNLISSTDKVIDEVSANALGLYLLSGNTARVIINIGGQDIKIIKLDGNGKLAEFKMNDKCAAGTGRFFEMAARILDTSIYEFAALSDQAQTAAALNSTCVVFAESEIVSLLAKGAPKESIIKGLHESIARRIASMMGTNSVDEVYLDGGSANNTALAEAIGDELFADVRVLEYPQFTVAYGAARSLHS